MSLDNNSELAALREKIASEQERIKHLNAVLLAIRKVNQLIVKENDRERLLKGVCNSLTETKGYYSIWIALFDEFMKSVCMAEAGLGEGFSRLRDRLLHGELVMCTKKALGQSAVTAIENPSDECGDCPLAKSYTGRDAMVVRIESGSKVYGVISVSVPSGMGKNEEEQALLAEVASDIAFALHGADMEAGYKRAEKGLRESEEKYRTLIESSLTGIFIHQDGKYVFVNNRFAEFHGYEPEELIGMDYATLIHPEEREIKKTIALKRLKGEAVPERYEVRRIRKDGKSIWCEMMATRIDYKGRSALMGNIIDITDRKNAEETLLESKERYRSLVESTEDTICLVDRDCRYLFINEKNLSRLGLPLDKVIGKTYGEFHPEEQTREFAEKVEEVFRTGKSVQYEQRSLIDGRDFLRTFSPVKGPNGKIVALTVISKEITDRKQAEEELIKADKELKEATAQLVHSEKMAALGELTAGVAHELNQPLNNIKIACQSLLLDINKNRLDKNTLYQDIKDVVEQVNKMAGIIDHMRIFTRRRETLNKEGININEPVNNMFILIGEQLRTHNINVIKNLAANLPRISGDPIALEQVFTNLMVNARAAVEDFRETERKIEIKSFMKNEKEVAVSIKDNGGGVPLNIRERIFEPFFTTKPPGKGTGLGLSITRKIIEEHNGRIELKIEEGEGSIFTVIFPVEN